MGASIITNSWLHERLLSSSFPFFCCLVLCVHSKTLYHRKWTFESFEFVSMNTAIARTSRCHTTRPSTTRANPSRTFLLSSSHITGVSLESNFRSMSQRRYEKQRLKDLAERDAFAERLKAKDKEKTKTLGGCVNSLCLHVMPLVGWISNVDTLYVHSFSSCLSCWMDE